MRAPARTRATRRSLARFLAATGPPILALIAPAARAADGFFSVQGTFTAPAALQDFLLIPPVNASPLFVATLHHTGGLNLAGDLIPGGSFDPTLTVSNVGGPLFSVFDDDSGPGLDAQINTTLPGALQTYNIRLEPFAASNSGRWALDVVGQPTASVTPMLRAGSRIDSITFGGRTGGFATLTATDPDTLAQAAVTVRGSARLDVAAATTRVNVGTLAGSGEVRLGASSTLVIGAAGAANSSSTFAGTLTGAGVFEKAGNGSLTLSGSGSTFTGDIAVTGGRLAVTADGALGAAAAPQTILLTGGAHFAGTGGGGGTIPLSPSRRVVVGAGGGRLGGFSLDAPGQLAGNGPLTIVDSVAINAANPNFAGPVTVDGGFLQLNAAGALGQAPVRAVGTTLALNVAGAVRNDVEVVSDYSRPFGGDASVHYTVDGAAAGHTITLAGVRPAVTRQVVRPTALLITSGVTSVGQDRFVVGADHVLQIDSNTPNLLTRNVNLFLSPGAIIQPRNVASIANLGNNNEFFYSTPLGPAGQLHDITLGVTGGTTPWRGLGDYFAGDGGFVGTIRAAADFLVQGPDFTGYFLDGDHVIAANPVKAIISRGIVTIIGANDFQNTTFSVEPDALLVANVDDAFHGASGLEVKAGGVASVGGGRILSLPTLRGAGQLRFAGGTSTLTIGGPLSSQFDGQIIDGDVNAGPANYGTAAVANLIKTGAGVFTLAGPGDYHGTTAVNQGTLAVGVNDAIPATTDVTVAAGALLDVGTFRDTIGSLAGAGTVAIGPGGVLSVGSIVVPTTFTGTIAGPGSLTKVGLGDLTLTRASTFTGPLIVRAGALHLSGTGGAASAPASISIATGGTLHLDSTTAGNHSAGNRLPDAAPVYLNGGQILLTGANNAVTTESLGPLHAVSGASLIRVTSPASGTAILSFASLASRSAGATVDFSASPLGPKNKIVLSGQPDGFIGGWATANRADFAKYSSSQGVLPFDAADYNTNTNISNLHLKLTGNNTFGNAAHKTLKIDTTAAGGAVTIQLTPFTNLDVSQGGLLKTGSNPAIISPTAGTTPFIKSSFGDLIATVHQGELTIVSRLGGNSAADRAFALTKSGVGQLTLAGGDGSGNTYAGKTFVNAGTLLLQKSFSSGTAQTQFAIPGDVEINGGTLRLAASDQIADTALITLNAGTLALAGFNETVRNVIVNGGTFESGSGVLTLTEATLNGGKTTIGAAPVPAGALLLTSPRPRLDPAPVVSTARKVTIVDGDNSVESNARLVVGVDGLTFRGGRTPTIRLAAAGTLLLNGDVFVNDAGTRAAIAGQGTVDLNGARIITPDPSTQLEITATIANGSFDKSGQGLLRLAGSTTLTGPIGVTGGTLQFTTLPSLANADVRLNAGTAALLLNLGTTHSGSASADFTCLGDATLTVDETTPVADVRGRLKLRNLATGTAAPVTLTIDSPTRVNTEFARLSLAGPATLKLSGALQITGPVTGPAGATLTKDGPAALTLAGDTPNTYAGATVVQGGGALNLAKPAGVPAIPGSLQVKGAGSVVRLLAGEQIADAASLDVTAGGTVDLAGQTETVNAVTVSANGQILTGGGSIVANSITLTTGGRIAVRAAGAAAAAAIPPDPGTHAPRGSSVLVTKALTLTDGTLDVANNALVVDYAAAGPSPLQSVRQRIATAYAGGTWTGPTGLTSSTAQADPTTALAYAEAVDVLDFGAAPTATFMGRTVDRSAVLVQYTLAGDANFDGATDFNDLVRLAQNYNTSGRAWPDGDFTYDGVVDFNDLVKLAQGYNTAFPPGPVAGASTQFQHDLAAAFAAVPEPSCLAAIVACGSATLRRRRRSNLTTPPPQAV